MIKESYLHNMQLHTVQYPPDFDGELYVYTNETRDVIGTVVEVVVHIRKEPGETTAQLLRRLGSDMQRIKGQ